MSSTRSGGPWPASRRWRERVTLPRDVTRLSWWRRQWRSNPRIALALRAALAAAVAWALATVLPGPAADYPYYAPFGAVIATTFTLAGSVRESFQSVGAIVVGGLVGWLVDLLQVPFGPLAVALVVVPSVILAGLPVLGAMGGWVPTAALFTLIIGHGEATYIGAYAGLTLFGALIGIGVNALLPPLPLAPAQSAVGLFRTALVRDLEALGDMLDGEELPTLAEWEQAHSSTPRNRARMHTALAEVSEATRRNRRARRYSSSIDALEEEGRTLDRLALVVNDLADLLLGDVAADRVDRSAALGGDVQRKIREAVRTIAAALENTTAAGVSDPHLGDDDNPMSSEHAVEAVDEARATSPREDDQLLVDGVLITLQRAVESLAKIERAE